MLTARVEHTDGPALSEWERRTHAVLIALVAKRVMTVDELRRGIEALDPRHYVHMSYYSKVP